MDCRLTAFLRQPVALIAKRSPVGSCFLPKTSRAVHRRENPALVLHLRPYRRILGVASAMSSLMFTSSSTQTDENRVPPVESLRDSVHHVAPNVEDGEVVPRLAPDSVTQLEHHPTRFGYSSRDQSIAPTSRRGSGGRRSSSGSNGGRKQSFVKSHCFEPLYENEVLVGSTCRGFRGTIRDKQRRATILARHAVFCLQFSPSVRRRIYSESNSLQKEFNQLREVESFTGSKRTRSFSAESPNSKHRTMSGSAQDADALTAALFEVFVEQVWAFTAFDTSNERPNAFLKFMQLAVPWYAEKHFPTRYAFTGRHLDALHNSVSERIRSRLRSALADGYGTLIFDGWGDSTSASVVNVLLRTEGAGFRARRKTFFLESVFTSHEK